MLSDTRANIISSELKSELKENLLVKVPVT